MNKKWCKSCKQDIPWHLWESHQEEHAELILEQDVNRAVEQDKEGRYGENRDKR